MFHEELLRGQLQIVYIYIDIFIYIDSVIKLRSYQQTFEVSHAVTRVIVLALVAWMSSGPLFCYISLWFPKAGLRGHAVGMDSH